MTGERIAELRALCAKTTTAMIRLMSGELVSEPWHAEFIGTARHALPAAIDEIERLQADNENLRALLAESICNASPIHDEIAKLQGESTPRGPQCEECKGTGRIESPFHGGGMDCPHCSGNGMKPAPQPDVECTRCGGYGSYQVDGQEDHVDCPDCNGTGLQQTSGGKKP